MPSGRARSDAGTYPRPAMFPDGSQGYERVVHNEATSVEMSWRVVRETYDELAANYEEVERFLMWQRPVELGLLFAFSRMLSGQLGTVGDVGCGPGYATQYLAQLDVAMVGVDLSPKMIEQARHNYPGGNFSVGNIESLEVADAAWAGAVALGTMWHHDVTDRRIALLELARVIRPGGVLLHSWLESAPGRRSDSTHRLSCWLDRDVSLDLHFVSAKTAMREAAAAGFEVLSVTLRQPILPHELPARRGFMLAKRLAE